MTINQTELTDTQEEFIKEMSRMINTLRNSVVEAEIINGQIKAYKETLTRIEEKTDHINSYLLKQTQEQIKIRQGKEGMAMGGYPLR